MTIWPTELSANCPVLGPTTLLLWLRLTIFIKLLFCWQRSNKPTFHCQLSIKEQTDKVNNSMKSCIMGHFAFKEPEFLLIFSWMGGYRKKIWRVDNGLIYCGTIRDMTVAVWNQGWWQLNFYAETMSQNRLKDFEELRGWLFIC